MVELVKLITNEDGERCEPFWHYVRNAGGSDTLLCTSEVYGLGEGFAVAEMKTGTGRGITCPECRNLIKELQQIKL